MTRTLLPLLAVLVALRAAAAETAPAEPCASPDGVCAASTNAPAPAGGKHIWASSRLYTDAPLPEMRKWLTDKPELDGKFVVVEFWRTWCGACKRMTPRMNALQKKFGAELAVVAVTGEPEEVVTAYAGPKKEYFLALDQPRPPEELRAAAPQEAGAEESPATGDQPCQATGVSAKRLAEQGRYEASFNVWGWPHVVILEPQYRTVVWEGFSGLKGFELTEAKVEKILAIGRAMKEEAKAKK